MPISKRLYFFIKIIEQLALLVALIYACIFLLLKKKDLQFYTETYYDIIKSA